MLLPFSCALPTSCPANAPTPAPTTAPTGPPTTAPATAPLPAPIVVSFSLWVMLEHDANTAATASSVADLTTGRFFMDNLLLGFAVDHAYAINQHSVQQFTIARTGLPPRLEP